MIFSSRHLTGPHSELPCRGSCHRLLTVCLTVCLSVCLICTTDAELPQLRTQFNDTCPNAVSASNVLRRLSLQAAERKKERKGLPQNRKMKQMLASYKLYWMEDDWNTVLRKDLEFKLSSLSLWSEARSQKKKALC